MVLQSHALHAHTVGRECITHRRDDTRAIRSYQPRLILRLQHVRDANHVVLRDTLCNANYQSNLRIDCLFDTCSGQWRRNENSARICPGLFHCIADAGEDWLAQVLCSSFLWIRAADDVGAILNSLRCVKSALSAREALKDHFCVACTVVSEQPLYALDTAVCRQSLRNLRLGLPFTLRFVFVEA